MDDDDFIESLPKYQRDVFKKFKAMVASEIPGLDVRTANAIASVAADREILRDQLNESESNG